MSLAPTPLARRAHRFARVWGAVDRAVLHALRGYYERAPHWVVLTTRGRRTGLPRQVLLPCARAGDAIVVVSTYGDGADWFRNLRREPRVKVTVAGRHVSAEAVVVDDAARKRAIVSALPPYSIWLFRPPDLLLTTVLRRPLAATLRWFTKRRPIVVLRLVASEAARLIDPSPSLAGPDE